MTPTLARRSQGNAGGGTGGGSSDGRDTRDEGYEGKRRSEIKGDEKGTAAGIRTLCMRFSGSRGEARGPQRGVVGRLGV